MLMPFCPQCKLPFKASAGRVNQAQKRGAPLYCDRICSGLARRLACPPTDEQRRAAKAAYDAVYRDRNLERIKAWKADHYRRTRDPVKEAAIRKARMHLHVEYCRRPEYKAWKSAYDTQYRAKKDFGPFAEAALLLQDIEREIDAQATRYEVYRTNGTLNKAQTRRRAL
jgi:hypothetical protein